MKITIGVENVLCTEFLVDPRLRPMPIQHTIDRVNVLHSEGHIISLMSSFADKETLEEYLKDWGVKYHQLLVDCPDSDMTIVNNSKPIREFLQAKNGKKLIVVIGDSWSAGVGTMTDSDLHTNDLVVSEQKYSWGNCIKKYLPDTDVVNLAIAGASNTTACQNIYKRFCYNDEIEKRNRVTNFNDYDDVIVVFMMTAPERVSYIADRCLHVINGNTPDDDPDRDNALISKTYMSTRLSDEELVMDRTIYSLLHLQDYCDSHGFKFLFGSAFYNYSEIFNKGSAIYETINWDGYMHNRTSYSNFKDYILSYPNGKNRIQECIHPDKLGYDIMSEEIADIIKSKFITWSYYD